MGLRPFARRPRSPRTRPRARGRGSRCRPPTARGRPACPAAWPRCPAGRRCGGPRGSGGSGGAVGSADSTARRRTAAAAAPASVTTLSSRVCVVRVRPAGSKLSSSPPRTLTLIDSVTASSTRSTGPRFRPGEQGLGHGVAGRGEHHGDRDENPDRGGDACDQREERGEHGQRGCHQQIRVARAACRTPGGPVRGGRCAAPGSLRGIEHPLHVVDHDVAAVVDPVDPRNCVELGQVPPAGWVRCGGPVAGRPGSSCRRPAAACSAAGPRAGTGRRRRRAG